MWEGVQLSLSTEAAPKGVHRNRIFSGAVNVGKPSTTKMLLCTRGSTLEKGLTNAEVWESLCAVCLHLAPFKLEKDPVSARNMESVSKTAASASFTKQYIPGERLFECKQHGKTYVRRSGLYQHMKAHTREQPQEVQPV